MENEQMYWKCHDCGKNVKVEEAFAVGGFNSPILCEPCADARVTKFNVAKFKEEYEGKKEN